MGKVQERRKVVTLGWAETCAHWPKFNTAICMDGSGRNPPLDTTHVHKGKHPECQYSAKCTDPECTLVFVFSYEIIKDNLFKGIANSEILSDLPGDPRTARTLEEMVTFIGQKGQGKATKSAVGNCSVFINHSSTSVPPAQHKVRFWACGEPSYGPINDQNTRAQYCGA
ncbi:hypothetical protein PoB_000701700 [Plakobranchus ocellatus]|uniref:Uncharacterized protein n=1 Tax=Plakobranchus ocellatus TaxID=259542 RepID=A0AAV3YED9_9GAST|nr:hypothetical protein PoB_000701700 [Plakobranchus ocellatus]